MHTENVLWKLFVTSLGKPKSRATEVPGTFCLT